jgi:hypothetical protein
MVAGKFPATRIEIIMSLEYAIEYPCEMRRRLGERHLRRLGRTGSLVSQIVNASLENDRPPSDESFRFTTELSGEIEMSEQVAAYCRTNCPAHLEECFEADWVETVEFNHPNPSPPIFSPEPIGCLGRIRYPIEARFERDSG